MLITTFEMESRSIRPSGAAAWGTTNAACGRGRSSAGRGVRGQPDRWGIRSKGFGAAGLGRAVLRLFGFGWVVEKG
jgi:hypothetical protein